jgi:hypothetical protein
VFHTTFYIIISCFLRKNLIQFECFKLFRVRNLYIKNINFTFGGLKIVEKKLIIPDFMENHKELFNDVSNITSHRNSLDNKDNKLNLEAHKVLQMRKETGLEGLVEGLDSIIIRTERDRQMLAVNEFLNYTGMEVKEGYEDNTETSWVLKKEGSASIIIISGREKDNPFYPYNNYPAAAKLPNTRLETFLFSVKDLQAYYRIQKDRGVRFMTDYIIDNPYYQWIQTIPSSFTGNSIGFIQWKGRIKEYAPQSNTKLNLQFKKPSVNYLENIRYLDHAATRVKAQERDAAIIEFMELTNYYFSKAIYVETLNSITNIARCSKQNFAMVFTSGILPYQNDEVSGPTEKFIHYYGPRVHHLAFYTNNLKETFTRLEEDGCKFMIGLVGSQEEGLHQTFSESSDNTLLVREYIHRYANFDGFFTKSNVTLLTKATDKQSHFKQ